MQDADQILHVGRSPYADPFLSSILFSMQKSHFPRISIALSSQYSFDLAHEVIAGTVDLGIATQPPESSLLTTAKIGQSSFYIGMSEKDVLAQFPFVTLEHLADRCWILFDRHLHPTLYDNVLTVAEAKLVTPRRVQHIAAPEEAFPCLEEGNGVAFIVKAGALRIAREGVTVRPLAQRALSLKTYLISRSDNQSKVMSALIRTFIRTLSTFKPNAASYPV